MPRPERPCPGPEPMELFRADGRDRGGRRLNNYRVEPVGHSGGAIQGHRAASGHYWLARGPVRMLQLGEEVV